MDKNLRAMCKTAMAHEKTSLKSMTLVTDIYKKNRQVLVKRHMSELNFVEQAQRLSRNLTSLQKYSSRMSQKLEAVHHQVLQQLEELYRTEVDISIKLQACTGSCQSASPLSVNHESYQDSMERLDKAFSNKLAAETPTQQVPRLKLLPADLGLVPSAEYKTIPIVQRELLTEFEDIESNQIILEDSVESDMLCSEC
ncbi:fibrinogen alpha chain [Nelusetta ayraudi]|uniref:fibrinogen alpha chain n=1 Tax=Nelusetta ayraudi TaxID=303726 RepID=UPI003F714CB8